MFCQIFVLLSHVLENRVSSSRCSASLKQYRKWICQEKVICLLYTELNRRGSVVVGNSFVQSGTREPNLREL